MNTNRINNKNLKRIAIAAGTTAAALFLSAGLVACDGKPGDEVVAPAEIANVADALGNLAAEVLPATDHVAVTEPEAAPVAATKTEPAKKSATSKKKTVANGGAIVLDAPAPNTATQPTTSPIAQPTQSSVAAAPAAQPTAGQDAATAAGTSGDQQPASTNTTSNIANWMNIPTFTGTPSLTSTLSTTDLTKLTSPITVPTLCIPGITC